MSLRALGRQFVAQHKNRTNPAWGGTERHPQGLLFHMPVPKYRPDADVVESGRRRNAGENNPSAPWKTPMLQHHFLTKPEPVQGQLDL